MAREQAKSTGQGGRRDAILRILRASRAPLSIVTIANELGVHPNTVRFHLDSLVADGLVEQVESGQRGPGRPPLMFQAVRQMDRGGTRHYRLLAEILTNGLAVQPDSSAMAQAVGRVWGEGLEPPGAGATAEESIDHLVGVLDDLGFAPERRPPGGSAGSEGTEGSEGPEGSEGKAQVGLRHCPFLELAEGRPTVVCPIHLGLMRGALETWAAPVTVERLEAFVEPDLCLVHLAPAEAPR